MYAVYVAAINGYKLEAGGHWKLAAMNSSTWFGAEGWRACLIRAYWITTVVLGFRGRNAGERA